MIGKNPYFLGMLRNSSHRNQKILKKLHKGDLRFVSDPHRSQPPTRRTQQTVRKTRRAISSVGRAPRLHRGCREFESLIAHHFPSSFFPFIFSICHHLSVAYCFPLGQTKQPTGIFCMDTVSIDNRGDFGLWAIERAKAIIAVEGSALAVAARDSNEDTIREAANALGAAITAALLEVYDGLLEDEE
jgi:hypothetical protein